MSDRHCIGGGGERSLRRALALFRLCQVGNVAYANYALGVGESARVFV